MPNLNTKDTESKSNYFNFRQSKASREKCQLPYKDKYVRITSDLSAQTLKARKAWNNIIQALRENNYQPRILYSAKLSFNLKGEIKTFQDNNELKQFMSTKPELQRILKGIIQMEKNEKQSQIQEARKE
jgi:hypothetical protein